MIPPNFPIKRENITSTSQDIRPSKDVKREGTVIYRDGRNQCFMFIEGNEDPVDLREIKVKGDAWIKRQSRINDIMKLFNSDQSLGSQLLQEYGIFVLVGILVMLAYISFKVSGLGV